MIGSGPIVIGQACEFDYSGTQACRVLRAEGFRVILVNSNPATIMTDPEFADATYVEPITPEYRREDHRQGAARRAAADARRPDRAQHRGRAARGRRPRASTSVELIGADFDAIQAGENRELFKGIVAKVAREHGLNAESARSRRLPHHGRVPGRRRRAGLPAGRAALVHDGRRRLRVRLRRGRAAPHRRRRASTPRRPPRCSWRSRSSAGRSTSSRSCATGADNVVIVCSIENIDPMGVHTGDSVTVAPALTLTDREYQNMRDVAIAVIREVGVDTGGCNIQFAVDPRTGRMIVIEMNPRVSRSSARSPPRPPASRSRRSPPSWPSATPSTRSPTTSPRRPRPPSSRRSTTSWSRCRASRSRSSPGADATLTTHMKSVGEAMAIGRSFPEALQKALRSLEKKGAVFTWAGRARRARTSCWRPAASRTTGGCVTMQQAIRAGATAEELYEATGVDPWFLDQLFAARRGGATELRRRRPS